MISFYSALIEDESDSEYFSRIYNEYQKQMHRAAKKILKDEQLAEDAVQNVFYSIARNVKNIKDFEKRRLRSYLLTSAKNAAVDIVRKESKHKTLSIDDFSNINDESATERMDSIFGRNAALELLDTLPQKYRDVLYMYYVLEIPEKEISEMLGIKSNTVRQQVFRGKHLLRDIYKKEILEKDETKL